jgi:hypothetical protein
MSPQLKLNRCSSKIKITHEITNYIKTRKKQGKRRPEKSSLIYFRKVYFFPENKNSSLIFPDVIHIKIHIFSLIFP